jgi:anti-sigma B factor antagonist
VETRDPDGVLRLRPVGELDLAVAEDFAARLAEVVRDRLQVRLDLAQLEFIDSTGIAALLRGLRDGCVDGCRLIEVERDVAPQVRRLIDLVGIARVLWPEDGQSAV